MGWNIFGKSAASQQTIDPSQVAGSAQQTGPFPGGASGVSTITGPLGIGGVGSPTTTGPFGVSYPLGTGLSGQQIQQMLQSFVIGLTQEEKDELANLEQEYAQELKSTKLQEFRKLPAELRQYIINAYSWNEAVVAIDQVTVEASARLKELKQKSTPNGLGQHSLPFWSGAVSAGGYLGSTMPAVTTASFNYPVTALPPLPNNITIDDLKSAHMEQTLEEEMLDEK